MITPFNVVKAFMPQKSPTTKAKAEKSAIVLRRFRIVFNAVRSHFKQVEKLVGLGGAQVWALSIVRDRPGIGMGDLARSMDVHQSTASNLVKGLQAKALLKVEKGSEDKRQVQLTIASEGLLLLAKVPGPFEGVLPAALERLPTKTLAQLDADLAKLIALLKVDESAGAIPLAQL